MNQDQGTYSISDDEYVTGDHPMLTDVTAFDGEGMSPVTVGTPLEGVNISRLAPAKSSVRRNDSADRGRGTTTPATPDDTALLIGTLGDGRFAVHFDRNTFFNANGAGTDITRLDNRRLAEN